MAFGGYELFVGLIENNDLDLGALFFIVFGGIILKATIGSLRDL